MTYKKGDTVIYPQHGACIVVGIKKIEAFGVRQDYLILRTVINEMTLQVPVARAADVGVRPPVSANELEDLVSVLSKADPRVPSNWSRRFKNHQEKLKSGDVYQVAEVVRNLAARNRDASLSAAERTMYERARVNLISEISPALKVSAEEAEEFLNAALERGVLKPAKKPKGPGDSPAATKKVVPAARSASRPVAKSPAKGSAKPVAKPAANSASKPATKAGTKKSGTKKSVATKTTATKSAAKPASKPATKKASAPAKSAAKKPAAKPATKSVAKKPAAKKK